MIRRFDELLAEKVNKHSIPELRKEIEGEYMKLNAFDQLKGEFEEIQKITNQRLESNKVYFASQKEKLSQ